MTSVINKVRSRQGLSTEAVPQIVNVLLLYVFSAFGKFFHLCFILYLPAIYQCLAQLKKRTETRLLRCEDDSRVILDGNLVKVECANF